MSKIVGNLAGCYSPMGRTFIFTDKDGNEVMTGVLVDQEKRFNASTSDVEEGKLFVNDEGASVGTGKVFGFVKYGTYSSNFSESIPNNVDDFNLIIITGKEYPVKLSMPLDDMKDVDFSTTQTIGYVVADNTEYPITVKFENRMLVVSCSKDTQFEVFYGKDNF